MQVRLVVLKGPDKGRVIRLQSLPLVVGRGKESNTQLSDPYASRAHCRVEQRGRGLAVVDLESSSGTFVNGEAVTDRVLQLDDVIRVGDTEMRLEQDVSDQETLLRPKPDVPVLPQPTKPAPRRRAPAPAKPAAGPRTGPPKISKVEELAGKELAYFRIHRVLARGASGMMFQATDKRDDGQVALKVLRPEFSRDAASVRRFIRAMTSALPLRHPNLVTVYGAGKRGPFCWVSAEYIEGESLTAILRRVGIAGMLDWKRAFKVAVHLARVLEFAHDRGIIHRNLTPQNVMIEDKTAVTRLSDMMLVKAFEGSSEDITRPGELIGDVRYMSPERTMGTSALDARSDLYGLGALVYALLTGRPPFEGKSVVETLTLIRDSKPRPPKQYQMAIPDLIQGVVLQLLANRPEDRFQTATELLRELERVGKLQGVAMP